MNEGKWHFFLFQVHFFVSLRHNMCNQDTVISFYQPTFEIHLLLRTIQAIYKKKIVTATAQ